MFVIYLALHCSHYWRNYDIKKNTESGLNRVSILPRVCTVLNFYQQPIASSGRRQKQSWNDL